ncbi:MAG TPA: methyltransferase domain-containing protein [Pyrinomonadaceae bacterium]|nr:methyltransferase domain-containing protein [Pyrinomonadaceae bacterium]
MTDPDSRPQGLCVETKIERFDYPGRELEAMDCAANYHRWILEIFEPFLGDHLVEVGAGLGSFSQLILERHRCQTLSLIEPSNRMYEDLVANAQGLSKTTRIYTYHGTFPQCAPLVKSNQAPDSIIYVNVLEHITDDKLELEAIRETLSPSGHVFLFVPALAWLFGAFDERVGHLRRYTKSEVEEKLKAAGFKITLSKYFDFPGIGPWWVKYCLLRSATMEPAGVRLYDRFVVPAARRIESIISPPLGKNVIAIAQKG